MDELGLECKEVDACSPPHGLSDGRNCSFSLSFFPIQHKISGQMDKCHCITVGVEFLSTFFFSPLFPSYYFPSPFFCPMAGMESVIEKQHCWNQLRKSLSSCGVKKPPLHWTLELAPFIHFSSACSGCPVGTPHPEDPLAAATHGGTSQLLNLDFLNLPTAWHIDKQPRFLAKVGNAHSLAVNCFVVLNHKTCSDSSLSNLPATRAMASSHREIKVSPSLFSLWASWSLSEQNLPDLQLAQLLRQ